MKNKPLVKVTVKGIKGPKAKKFNAILTRNFNKKSVIKKLLFGSLIIFGERHFPHWGNLEPTQPKSP